MSLSQMLMLPPGYGFDSAPSPLLTNLLAWWALGEASGNRLDSHSGGYDLTAQNAPGNTTGKIGNCLSQSASNQGLYLSGNPAAFQISTFSLCCWFKTSSAGASLNIASKLNAWALGVDSGTLKAYDWILGGWQSTSQTVNDGNWHHLAYTRQNGTNGARVYLDGTLRLTYTANIQDQASNLFIGNLSGFSVALIGQIDEVAIWNAIIGTDIMDLHRNSGSGTAYPGGS